MNKRIASSGWHAGRAVRSSKGHHPRPPPGASASAGYLWFHRSARFDPGGNGNLFICAGGGRNETELRICCHGTSRALSRTRALKIAKGRAIHRELEDIGVFVQSRGKQTLKEEMPQAYKNISQVVEVVHKADLARKVTRLIPTGIIIRLNKTFTKRSPLSLRF